jgi:tetratricopeptide (TPR) repeat protein
LTFALVVAFAASTAAAWWSWTLRSAAGELSIAVANFEGDDSGQYGRRIVQAIGDVPNVRLIRGGRMAVSPDDGTGAGERTGHDRAHDRLEDVGADVLIWGSLHGKDGETRVTLRWTPVSDLPIAKDFGRYETVQGLTLPPLLWEDLKPVLQLLAATYAADLRGMERQAAADAYFPFVVPVYDTLAQPAEGGWTASTGARIAQVLANALFRYAEQTDQRELLEDAIAMYRDVLAAHARWHRPLEWASAESQLGAALAALGDRESDEARLTLAVDAFRTALWEQTPERAPLDWAKTQINLGNALTALGTRKEREVSAARLEEAVGAYRAALTDVTRQRMPLTWAATQNNLGSVLKALGDLTTDTARFEEAATAYRAALTIDTRSRMPLQWATVQSNLASVLVRLGEARSDPARLQEAVRAYRAALKERPRDEMPLAWAATQNNLGNALRVLGQIRADTSQLEEAADAYSAALVEFTRAKSDHQIDTTKRNLERTLRALSDRKPS